MLWLPIMISSLCKNITETVKGIMNWRESMKGMHLIQKARGELPWAANYFAIIADLIDSLYICVHSGDSDTPIFCVHAL